MTNVETFKTALLTAIDSRATYESNKNPENENMQRTLKDLRASLDHNVIAEIMLNCNVSADFINRAERNNARFNVYSAEKVVNVARTIAKVASLNHYSLAIVRSMIALAKVELTMTHKDAVAACSLSVKTEPKKQKVLKQYQKHVAANTATTQASSSLNALVMCSIVSESRDESNNVVYAISDTDAAKSLIACIQ